MKNSDSGLSTVEVLFALGIMAIVLLAVLNGFNQSAAQGASSKNRIAASEDAKKILEHARSIADTNNLTGTGSVSDQSYWTDWIQSETTAGTFSNLTGATRALTTFQVGTGEDPLGVRATVTWQEKGGTKSYSLDTMMTKRKVAQQ